MHDRALTDDQSAAGDSHAADPATPAWITPELIAETIRVWQPYYRDPLAPEDAVVMMQSVGRLLKVLRRNDLSK